MKYRFSIVACARWEVPYIVEWITYYRVIGFDHIFLYCNDDDPRELYEKVLPFTLGANPFVTFYFFPHQGLQPVMYEHFLKNHLDETEWVSFFDIDEFLRLPSHQKISDFMVAFEPICDCLMFNWIWFGPNGHRFPPPGNVLANYTKRQIDLHCLTKYVARSELFRSKKFLVRNVAHWYWHNLKYIVERQFRVINVLGEDMEHYYHNFPEGPTEWVNESPRKWRILSTAVMNHYVFRSEQAFEDRVARGLKGQFSNQIMWKDAAKTKDYPALIEKLNAVSDLRLAKVWDDFLNAGARLANITSRRSGELISAGKSAMQSSVCEWSVHPTPEADARGALNGVVDGTAKFHTNLEYRPWWQIDLGRVAKVREIIIYNTIDQWGARFKNFVLAVAIEQGAWITIFQKEDNLVVGGINSSPFIWTTPQAILAQHIRITLLDQEYLHLDQVEVYGEFV